MVATGKPLSALTAEDVMSREVVAVPSNMPLAAAARLLGRAQVSGAPVVDERQRCVGVLSAGDFVRWGASPKGAAAPGPASSSPACSFQQTRRVAGGREIVVCALPPPACPFQEVREGPGGREVTACSQPHCFCTDWQVDEAERFPAGAAGNFMTADPVTASPDTPVPRLARMMLDAHIHRVIIVDAASRPVGVVSSTDLLALLVAGTTP